MHIRIVMKHKSLKTITIPLKLYEALHAQANKSASASICEALQDYVDGKVTVVDDTKGETKMTSFLGTPELLDKAVDKAKAEGLTLTRLIILLLKDRLIGPISPGIDRMASEAQIGKAEAEVRVADGPAIVLERALSPDCKILEQV